MPRPLGLGFLFVAPEKQSLAAPFVPLLLSLFCRSGVVASQCQVPRIETFLPTWRAVVHLAAGLNARMLSWCRRWRWSRFAAAEGRTRLCMDLAQVAAMTGASNAARTSWSALVTKLIVFPLVCPLNISCRIFTSFLSSVGSQSCVSCCHLPHTLSLVCTYRQPHIL